MNCYFSEELLSDLDLLNECCKQSCRDGVRDQDTWHPPHRITHIKLEVEDYEGGFTKYEKETIEKACKGA